MNTTPPQKKSFGQWIKTSLTIRMMMIGILILVMLIPLSFIESLIRERAFRQEEVVKEINEKWGNEVLLYGPLLKVPYNTHTTSKIWDEKTKVYKEEKTTAVNYAYFFPADLSIDSKIATEPLDRGIYESIVYTADINISGKFDYPNFETQDIAPLKQCLASSAVLHDGICSKLDRSCGACHYLGTVSGLFAQLSSRIAVGDQSFHLQGSSLPNKVKTIIISIFECCRTVCRPSD